LKLKDLLKNVGEHNSLPADKLKKAEDYKETLKKLIIKAKRKNPGATPIRGSWEKGLTNYGKDVMLYYDDEKKNTRTVKL